jgi:hypothetical protein
MIVEALLLVSVTVLLPAPPTTTVPKAIEVGDAVNVDGAMDTV